MPDRPVVYNATLLGVEATPGVAVSPGKRILDFMVEARPQIPVHPYRPQGSVSPSTATLEKEWVSAAVTGQIGFQSLIYILNSLLLTGTITTPTGGTLTRRHTFVPANFAPDAQKTYTVQKGSTAGAEQFSYGMFNSLTMRFTRTEASLTSAMMGQSMLEQGAFTFNASPTDIAALPIDPRSASVFVGSSTTTNQVQTVTQNTAVGTFTLSYEGSTTTPITAGGGGSTGAQVQALLEALPTIGKNNVSVSGAAGGPYVATFQGNLAGVQASLLVASTPTTSGTVTVAETTPAGLTRLTRVSSAEVAIPDRYAYGFTLDTGQPSFSYFVQQGVEPTAQIVLEHDSASAAFMTDLRARNTKYCRILCRGPVIETISQLTFMNWISITFPFKFLESDRGDVDAVFASTYNLSIQYDTTFGGFLSVVVDNALAAL